MSKQDQTTCFYSRSVKEELRLFEILFQAGIHPKVNVNQLGAERLERLFRVMREQVLPTTIECRADPSEFPDDFIGPHREKGGPCLKCGHILQQLKVSGHTSYACPDCQNK